MENFTIKQKFTGLESSERHERMTKAVSQIKKQASKVKNLTFGLGIFNNYYHGAE